MKKNNDRTQTGMRKSMDDDENISLIKVFSMIFFVMFFCRLHENEHGNLLNLFLTVGNVLF